MNTCHIPLKEFAEYYAFVASIRGYDIYYFLKGASSPFYGVQWGSSYDNADCEPWNPANCFPKEVLNFIQAHKNLLL